MLVMPTVLFARISGGTQEFIIILQINGVHRNNDKNFHHYYKFIHISFFPAA